MFKKFPLAIVLETIDKSTKTIQKINDKFSGLNRTLSKLQTRFKLLDKEAGLSKSLEGVKKSLKSLTVYGAVAGFVANKLVRGFTQSGNAIADTAERIGVGVEWLQKMRHAGERNQLTAEETDDALQKFSKTIGETAAGTGKAVDIFEAWGLSVFDAQGKVKTMEKLLPEVADKLAKIENANVRNAVAARLFGDAGSTLALAMKDGAKGLEAYFVEAEKLGIMTEQQTKDAKAFEEQMLNLRKAFEGIRNALIGPMIPALTEMLTTLTNFMARNRDAIAGFGKALVYLASVFAAFKILALLWNLLLVLKAIGLIFIGLASIIGAPALAIVAAIMAIVAVGYYFVKHWEGIRKWWRSLWGGMEGDTKIKIGPDGKPVASGPRYRGDYGVDPASAATAGSGGSTNTNNAAVRVDINGLGKNDSVTTKTDKGMPFSFNQGFVGG